MALYLIGIGLHDEKDITLKGLELVKQSDIIYLENYTSMLHVSKETLEKLYGKKITLLNREQVENYEPLLENAKTKNIALLIIGDVFSATTHYELYKEAKHRQISIEIVYNASVLTAVSITGLMLYNFGKTTSIPFPQKGFEPETAYDVIKQNQSQGLHTLVLLDLKPEQNKFMTVQEGIQILLSIEQKRKEKIFTENTSLLGCARLGNTHTIFYGPAKTLLKKNFGEPLHCLIVPGKLHFVEEDALELWK